MVRRRLIALRQSRGMTQAQVAQALGLSRAYYTQLEAGRRTPSLAVGLRIARFFDVSFEELFAP